MTTIGQQPPRFSETEARSLAGDLFGVTGTARPLPSERDQNFLLETDSGPEFVLKISNSSESRANLEAQNQVLEYLAHKAPSLRCPRVMATTQGEPIGQKKRSDGSTHLVRLLSYVPGHLLVDVSPHTPELLHSLGLFFARLDQALASFSHPALKRELQWDLARARHVVGQHVVHIEDRERRSLVTRFHQRFLEIAEPALPSLRQSVIHNDGNDYNVLVTGLPTLGGEVTGVVDFGDMVSSCTVFELAVCAAYAILDKADPVAAAADVVGGYHSANPLTELELRLLYDLIAMRLCTSVTMSASQQKSHPENAYLTVSEVPAWTALERLARVNPRYAHYAFRAACGMPACPRSAAVVKWLSDNQGAIGPVASPDVRTCNYVTFDLAAGGSELVGIEDPTDPNLLAEALFGRMRTEGASVGVGRYDEARRSYTTEHYRPLGSEVEDWRTVHLGIDLFLKPGSPVFAPLEGSVHSFRNNAQAQDYGPTIILRHEVEGVGEFYTLYGHLREESLNGVSVGMQIAKGRQIGAIGESSVNGFWPPHLHFQLITDLLDYSGDFPGVCADRTRAVWLSMSPDPNLILSIPDIPEPDRGRSPRDILEARQTHLGKTLTASYEKPLCIVQGWMQYVYDHLGREFLDAVNNVAHVGHCHPTVVKAAQQQMSVLNTNTRYLHRHIVEYAERLCATLPRALSVCYFVCSGSEANELALRLSRAHTRATDVLVIDGGYHGNTSTLVEISPYKFDGPGGAGAPPYVHKVVLPDLYRGPQRGRADAGQAYAHDVRRATEHATQEGRKVAGFICESMLSCGGQIVLPPEYLPTAYEYVRAAGGVCIADEIQVGFGRVGSHFWAFQTHGVVPDIVTMGKPMGNGHPLAAVVTTPEIAASFENGMEYFNTFGGNPVSCAIGLAVLDVLKKENLQERARSVGRYMKDTLSRLMARHPMLGDVRGEGLFIGVELVRDRETLEPAGVEASYVAERMKQLGVLVGTDGADHNVLKIKPPMVFTQADADRLVKTLDVVLSEPRLRALRAEVGTRS